MIVGKYFESNRDFINVMKVAERYHDLVRMYHFNPIQDYSLFNNMQTQHLYEPEKEVKPKKSFIKSLFGNRNQKRIIIRNPK